MATKRRRLTAGFKGWVVLGSGHRGSAQSLTVRNESDPPQGALSRPCGRLWKRRHAPKSRRTRGYLSPVRWVAQSFMSLRRRSNRSVRR